MSPLPSPDPGAFRVKKYLFDQLDGVEREIKPWLQGTDDSKGPIPITLAVRVALVMAYQRGMIDARASFVEATYTPEEGHSWPETTSRSSATRLAIQT